jgi:hypothetical protein
MYIFHIYILLKLDFPNTQRNLKNYAFIFKTQYKNVQSIPIFFQGVVFFN